MGDDVAIKVDNVSKNFVIPHEKVSSLKSYFTHGLGHRGESKTVQHALRNISFEVKKGEFFGIVGRNGSGKSTLLKILAGIYQPTSGQIHKSGMLVPFIELGVGFNPELSGRDNVYLNGAIMGFSKKEIDAMYNDVVEFAELGPFMDKKLKNYSSGMQVRLAFSMATRAHADILLIDEVLAVGDADFQKKCFSYFKNLKQQSTTVIFVSHDMRAVEEYCDRAVLIEDSRIVVRGTSREVATSYTRMFLEQEKAGFENKQKRWGDNSIHYEQVTLTPKKLDDTEKLTISVVANVKKDVEEGVFGFKVRDNDDKQMLGTNNKLRKKTLTNLKKGDRIKIKWQVPNIFNTGNYAIDVAIQNADYSEVYDWWEDAASLQVERSEGNSYPIHPTIGLSIKKE